MPRKAHDPARDPAYLEDMLAAADAIRSFVSGRTRRDYACDLMLRSAVERQIEIIGEAARLMSAQTKSAHPHIPWEAIMAQRHRLAHEYGDISDDLIWTVATLHRAPPRRAAPPAHPAGALRLRAPNSAGGAPDHT